MTKAQSWYQQREGEILEELSTFLSFPSISADPAHKDDVLSCADWLENYLLGMGLEVERWVTSGHPTLFAASIRDESLPTVLFYHHYDVQPADPLEEWESDPFSPSIRGGNIYARGALDNKGQCFYTLQAIKSFLENVPEAPVNIKICIEGEEETGSQGLSGILDQKKESLNADYLLLVDCDILGEDTPSITLGLRGILPIGITCKAGDHDLHSGNHGGIAMNPARELMRVVSSLWNDEGQVAIPGFYDQVVPMKEEEKKELYNQFSKKEYKKSSGVHALAVEEGYTPLEANWLRPSLEINGVTSGYGGEGMKTIIPATASVKLSVRIVPDQDPNHLFSMIKKFFIRKMSPGIELSFETFAGGKAIRLSPHASIVKIVQEAYEEVFSKPCHRVLCGASIPVAVSLAEASGAEPLFIGMGVMEDAIHSPNEHFALRRFEKGFCVIHKILEKISKTS